MRQLYHTPLSPFCRKVRLLLREKDLEFQLVQENPWEKSLGLFALNPAGEVPVLTDEDGSIISGTYAICEYIEDIYTSLTFLGKTAAERAEVRRIVDWFDHKFDYEVTQNVLFEKIFKRLMGYGPPNVEALRFGKENILYHLDYIGHMASERYFLAGEYLTLADLAAASHLSALDYLGDVPWDHNGQAAEWYRMIKCRPSMRAILADRIMGVRPPGHYEDLDF